MSVCRNCEEKIGGYCHGCMNNTVDTLTAQLVEANQKKETSATNARYYAEKCCQLETQLAERDAEIALLRKQSVGWVAVFDENASLREEVGRLKGSSMWRSKHSNTFHCDCSECVTTTKSREKIREEGRKQAAQEIYNSLQKCFWAVDFETVRANLKHKFGLEG